MATAIETTPQTVGGMVFALNVEQYGGRGYGDYRAYLRDDGGVVKFSHRGDTVEDATAKVIAFAVLCMARDEYKKVSGRFMRFESD